MLHSDEALPSSYSASLVDPSPLPVAEVRKHRPNRSGPYLPANPDNVDYAMFRGGALSSVWSTRYRPSDPCNKAVLSIMTEKISQVLRLIFWVYLRREKWLNP